MHQIGRLVQNRKQKCYENDGTNLAGGLSQERQQASPKK